MRVVVANRSLVNRALFLFVGNSLTLGSGAAALPADAYPTRTMSLWASGDDWENLGLVSLTTAQLQARAAADVDPRYLAGRYSVCVFWEIGNDLWYGASQADAYTHLVDYCTARRAVGFRVVVLTCLPRFNGSTPASYETDRLAINTLIRANWTSYADALADVALATGLDSSSYYPGDGIHLNTAGYAIVAATVATSFAGLVP